MTDISTDAKNTELPHIDGFEILSLAGAGGMSVVYRARQANLDRIVAIKMLHRHLVVDRNSVQRFMKEARLSTRLEHPNIATVIRCGATESDQPYLVMEFLEGELLKDKLERQGPLSPAEFCGLFKQICAGLQCAHDAGVVHRDLKPGNIVLVEGQNGGIIPKIVDFGIAKLIELPSPSEQKLTQTGSFIGSPAFMSPEQCSSAIVDSRSDIYSLGCLMYEALSGRTPFTADNLFAMTSAHLRDEPAALYTVAKQEIPQAINDIVMRCLDKDPDQRPQSAAEIADSISQADLSIAATGPALKRQRKRTKFNTAKMAAVASLFLLTAAAIYGIWSVLQDSTIDGAEKEIAAGHYSEAASLLENANLSARSAQNKDRIAETEYLLAVAALENNDPRLYNRVRDALIAQRNSISVAPAYGWVLKSEHWRLFVVAIGYKNKNHRGQLSITPFEPVREPDKDRLDDYRRDASGNPYLQYLLDAEVAQSLCVEGKNPKEADERLLTAIEYAKKSGRPEAVIAALYRRWQWEKTHLNDKAAKECVDEAMTYVPQCGMRSNFLAAQSLAMIVEPIMYANRLTDLKAICDAQNSVHSRTVFPGWLETQAAYDQARYCQSQGDLEGVAKYGEIGIKRRVEMVGVDHVYDDDLFCQFYVGFVAPEEERQVQKLLAEEKWKEAMLWCKRRRKLATICHDNFTIAASLSRIYHCRRHLNPKDTDIALLEQALSAIRKSAPPGHKALCAFLSELGGQYYAVKMHDKAVPLLEECVEIIKDRPELRKERIATAPIVLARIYAERHENEKAKALFSKYLDEAAREYGGNKDLITNARITYASLLANDGRSPSPDRAAARH